MSSTLLGNATPTTRRNRNAPVPPTWNAQYVSIRPFGADDIFMEIAEMEVALGSGGTDLCTGGSGLGTWNDIANAFNNNPGNFAYIYSATGLTTSRIGYGFTSAQTFDHIRLTATSGNPLRTPAAFFVDTSPDGVTWTCVGYCIADSGYISSETKAFTIEPLEISRATARVWAVNVLTNNGGWTSIAELQFRATSGGATQCVGGFGWASRSDLTSTPFRGFDGNPATFWQAGAGIVIGQLIYNFQTAPNPAYMAIQARNAIPADAPASWAIQYTLDGLTWTTTSTVTGQTAWGISEVREFAV